jgi:hypothetical protein
MEDRDYCLVPDCDEAPRPGDGLCETHQREDMRHIRRRRTRQERLQGLADQGCDTWDDYNERN